ncbi:mitochondrial protein Fmp26 [Ophiocordyceps camponoti-floridani]|uniref:Altered inheritance of mitochondria protein 24, mitochondrial n=1 Tax=Ophiocordyceps camponoti-floridani TaxID=2030778 RepID=A0A8H4Q7L3_9HYPO|nr:mitochondrial protein Fmp26 [Ophiocordyceps camponoti-floridani]
MRFSPAPLLVTVRPRTSPFPVRCLRRSIQISASPSSDAPTSGFGETADARFEVLGSAFSLLSVKLSASQRLYTRRGTLVALTGEPANVRSKLSLLNPLPRAPLGVPFLYQRVSSTTPVTALIATRSPATSFSVVHLDGTTDWMISQRNALLAWTGHTLRLSSRIRTNLSMAHWGSTLVTGRGLLALSSPGQTYRLTLAEGETMAAHPANVVAYSLTSRERPQPFRFRATDLRLEVPSAVTSWLERVEILRRLRASPAYKTLARALWRVRTTARRTVLGDRLLLQFRGPATLLLSSRGVSVADVLSREQVNEMADAPAGAVTVGLEERRRRGSDEAPVGDQGDDRLLHVEEGSRDGKVTFQDERELKESLR